jgi:hypothetical protein
MGEMKGNCSKLCVWCACILLVDKVYQWNIKGQNKTNKSKVSGKQTEKGEVSGSKTI